MKSACTATEEFGVVGITYSEDELADAFVEKLDPYFDELKKTQAKTGEFMGAAFRGKRFATVEEAFAGAQAEYLAERTTSSAKKYGGYERGNRFGLSCISRGGRGRGRGRGARDSGDGGGRGRGRDKSSSDDKEEKQSDDIVCFYCDGRGHRRADCPSTEKSTVVCYGCGGVGHYKSQCPSEPLEESEKA